MFLKRILGGEDKERFTCLYDKCLSRCCKNNLVILNEEDMERFHEAGINLDEAAGEMELNRFLETLGSSPMRQLEGLNILRLRQDPQGRCLFLSEEGTCNIYENRPYHCRDYPFRFKKKGFKIMDRDCPGIGVGEEKGAEEIKAALGLQGLVNKPPHLIGDAEKLRTSRTLMSAVFRLMR